MSRLGVIVNPTAGRGRGRTAGARTLEVLAARGHDVVDLSGDSADQTRANARQAATEGLGALVVVGGDGMFNIGVNVVAETDVPLGLVAAGTGNDIARTLGLPRHDVARSVDVIERALEDGARRVDAASVGPAEHSVREWFFSVLSCGFDAAVNARANALKWPNGALKYWRAIGIELRTFAPFGYRVTTDDAVWESPGTLVAVANGPRYGGGFQITPDAQVDDGLLDVMVSGPLTRRGIVRWVPSVRVGTHLRNPAFQVLRTRSVLVEVDPRHGAHPPVAFVDGERLGPLPLRAEAHPGILRVLA